MAQVICNDGTTDVDNGAKLPCLSHGGVNQMGGGIAPQGNPKDCGEFDISFSCWKPQAKIGFGIGTALMVAYGINKKKSIPSIIGLGLLGAVGGLAISSFIKQQQNRNEQSN